MKKIFYLILLSIIFQISMAQSGLEQYMSETNSNRDKNFIKRLHSKNIKNYKVYDSDLKLYKAGKQILTKQLDEILDTITKSFNKNEETEFIYDANKWLKTEIVSGINSFSQQWQTNYKVDYTRNTDGTVSLSSDAFWSAGKSTWDNYSKTEFTYNTNKDILTEIYSEWDGPTSKWMIVSKIEYTYDVKNQVLMDVYSEWNGLKYNLIDKFEYSYDGNGNQLTNTYSTWNISKYTEVDQYQNSYDLKNNLAASLLVIWDNTNKKWVNDSKDVFSYDAMNNISTTLNATWNLTNSIWVNNDKTVNTYDTKNNQILSIYSIWDFRTSKWNNSTKSESSFDTTILNSFLILPFGQEEVSLYFKTKHIQTNQFDWNKLLGEWVKSKMTTYTYTPETGTILGQNKKLSLNIFPNPSNKFINIEVNQGPSELILNIYEINGKFIIQVPFMSNEKIDISNLNPGFYNFQIFDKNISIGNIKFIKN